MWPVLTFPGVSESVDLGPGVMAMLAHGAAQIPAAVVAWDGDVVLVRPTTAIEDGSGLLLAYRRISSTDWRPVVLDEDAAEWCEPARMAVPVGPSQPIDCFA